MDVFLTGLPKKLLVATSVLVIIAMVVVPSEARKLPSSEPHKLRHERADHRHPRVPTTNTAMRVPLMEHRRHAHGALKQQKSIPADRFKNATKKIIKKLKNTWRFFNEERRVLNETREYRDGMPDWLPTINFVDIHFRSYKKRKATLSERKFAYLIPKLYKSLMEYHGIFDFLIKVEIDFADDPFCSYNKTRHQLIGKSLERLYSTIAEIKENMVAVNISVPPVNVNKPLPGLEMKVDAPQCLKNDYIAFRAYGNLLNNWLLEFRCPHGKKIINTNSRCRDYETRLKEKKDKRNKNTER